MRMSAQESPEPRSIGDRLRYARKLRGLNQAGLAERVGVSQPSVANWESGVHDPRRVMLAKIADVLGVSPEWLASGDRSAAETDKQPAAAYLRRALRHAPVIAFEDTIWFSDDQGADPHAIALDYIPITSGAEKVFAFFVDDEAMDRAFPKNTLIVVDYGDRKPADGAFVLFSVGGSPLVRRWREAPARLEPVSESNVYGPVFLDGAPAVIGCVRVAIRFH
jgi:transcriptional regulator with XRE-family HTH domain